MGRSTDAQHDPVPRHRRNPRRGYDRDGRELPAATVATCAAAGDRTIQVHCHTCRHSIILGLDGLPGDMPLPDIPLRLHMRCRCGSRAIGIMIDVHAHYARCRGQVGGSGEPSDGYRVTPWRDVVGPTRTRMILDGTS